VTQTRVYRCAVYTRKSHEEGLDQDFNSLDAQSEACRAYIASQAGLGWALREKPYDDGGISGGHMERPGLQELIADIKARLIDVIVVYKVDRLTRSLTDFAKLVDVFDEHGVSFVSVTQAFNTTTSMGRLTLNVLLSFAQFEREVTAERIRDKIAASKAKGMWMGGSVPIGYCNEDRKLFIREDEAQIIRLIYELYLQHKNVRLVKAAIDEEGIVTRRRTMKSGKVTGGSPFSRGHIYRILTNPIYAARIQHKAMIYEGNHDAIIALPLWENVQAALKDNAVKRSTVGNSKSPALLAGLLTDDEENHLVPHHANKKGKRYHYYVSQRLKTGDQDTGWRIPAKVIEKVAVDTLVGILCSASDVLSLLKLENISVDQMQSITKLACDLGEKFKLASGPELKAKLNELIRMITLSTDEITISFNPDYLSLALSINLPEGTSITLNKPMTIRRRGQEMKMVIGGEMPQSPNLDQALIKLLAKAYLLKTRLDNGSVSSIKDFATEHDIDHADAKRMLPLGYMAPDIVESILAGTQPNDLTALKLKNGYKLPALWAEQRAYLGFPSKT